MLATLSKRPRIGATGALTAIACCGPLLVQWLAQVVFAVGGVAALVFLVRYEAVIALTVAAGAWLGWRTAADRRTRAVSAILGVAALLNGLVRFVWDLDRELIQALPLVYWPFTVRQTILALLAALVLAVRLASLARVCQDLQASKRVTLASHSLRVGRIGRTGGAPWLVFR